MRSQSFDLKINLRCSGETAQIIATLDGLATLMHREAAAVVLAERAERPTATRAQYLDLISRQATLVSISIEIAESAFKCAALPDGSPARYACAYRELLGNVQMAADAARNTTAPESLEKTAAAFSSLMKSIVDQLRSWPERMLSSARGVAGTSCEVVLEVHSDVDAFYAVLRSETDGCNDFVQADLPQHGEPAVVPERMYFHPSTDPAIIADAIHRAIQRKHGKP